MAYCNNCGTQLQEGAKFCPSCGQVAGTDPTGQDQRQAGYQPPVMQQTPSENDAQENKTMAILAYILFFVPLLTGAHKTSPYVKYHTNQGTVLFLASLAFGVAYGILTAIFTAILLGTGAWGLWSIVTTILGLCWLFFGVLVVLGIINAATGKMKPLPLIGKFTIIK